MTPSPWILLALLPASLACSTSREPTGAAQAAPAPAKAKVRDAGLPDASPAEVKAHMRAHFAAVSELQRAIARGHLDQARALARWLLEHEEKPGEGWQPFLSELRAAAREVASAPDLPTAGRLAGRLGRACSRCHEDRGAVVSFTWTPAPDDEPTLRAQMERHQWAAARLWEGLVGPSNEMWSQGATVLAGTRLDRPATARADDATLGALVAQVRELATRAGQLSDHDARGKLYGELLSTCASCHQLARPRPVPGP